MALIRCSECGHEVSDKASTCPNCGCPIEKGLVCSECGNGLNPNDEICPKCGNPIKGNVIGEDKPIAKYILFSLIIVLLLGGGYFAYTHFGKSDNHTDVSAVSFDTLRNGANLSEQVDEAERAEEERKIEAARQSYLEHEQKKEQQQEKMSWIYGTWTYTAYGSTSKFIISRDNITIYSDGNIEYNGTYEIRGNELHYNTHNGMSDYIIIDNNSQRLKADETSYLSRVSSNVNSSSNPNNTTRSNIGTNTETSNRIARLERKAQDDINELNAMVSSGRMHPATLMYLKQNLPRELTELMGYYSNQGNTTKYNDYAYKKRVVLGVFRDLGM